MADFFNRITNQNLESDNQSRIEEIQRLKDIVQIQLPRYTNNQPVFGVTDQDQIAIIKQYMRTIINQSNTILRHFEIDDLIEKMILEITSLGIISPLMEDPSISEIMINAYDEIWIERNGKKELTNLKFQSEEEVLELGQRIVRNIGRLLDVAHPYVDGRLPDGSRVNIIIPPVSRKGTTITIRKFFKEKIGIDGLIKFNTLTPEIARYLEMLVASKCNIVISGGTGSGKTTTLNVLSNFVPNHERIVTIEDSAELQLNNAHVVSLESKEANAEGRGQVTIQTLVKNTLRMYPDRIIIGELRDSTAYNFLQAANTGHDGSMCTIHANNPDECITRLSSLVLEGGILKDPTLVTRMIGESVNIIVQVSKINKRRVLEYISEVITDSTGDTYCVPIYQFRVDNVSNTTGEVQGEFIRTNHKLSNRLLYKITQAGYDYESTTKKY